MNKRSLLSFAMCSLLLGSLPVGLVGCKDYDGDIKKLDTTTGNLSSQVSTLQSALDAAKQAADAAANDAKAAAAKADSATQEVALAKQAVEEAKAEAIQTALDAIKDGNFASTDDLAALSGKLEGIETGLSKIQADFTESQKAIAELNKQISAMDVQIKALENLKASVEQLKGDVAAIDGLSEKVAAIDGITAELNQIKADAAATKNAAAANKADVAELKTAVADAKSKLANVSSEISTQVTNAVNSIAGILAQRLTSVTLIPELYVGGVPTIQFEAATYKKLEWKADKDEPAKGKYVYIPEKVNGVEQPAKGLIANHAVEAKYRLNPATITASDIELDALAYVTEVATFKATRAEEDAKFAVSGAEVGENGLLTVKLDNLVPGKFTENLNDDEDMTASLRIPVAKKHLFEGETSAVVYSEFVRMTEKSFTPYLGLSYKALNRGDYYVNGFANNQRYYWPYTRIAYLYNSKASDNVVKNIAYDSTYDLNDLFIGIMGDKDGNNVEYPDTIKYSDLASYGLGIKYKIGGGEYIPNNASNGVNQQQYVKLSGENNNILTPQTPSGATANQAIIGKAPILVAEMYDLKTGDIVDAEYFKVMFSAQEVDNIILEFPAITEYKGDACNMYYSLTWQYMTKNLLEKLNGGKGMSMQEFSRIYTDIDYNQIPNSNMPTPHWTYYWGNSGDENNSPDTPAMQLRATPNILGKLSIGDNDLQYGMVWHFKPCITGYPTIDVTINWMPTLKVTAATLGNTLATNWNGNTMQIRVMPMTASNTKAKYATNILDGRIKPYVNGLLECTDYQIVYAPAAQQDAKLMEELNNYCGEPLTFTSESYTNATFDDDYDYPWDYLNQKKLEEVIYKIDPNNSDAKKSAAAKLLAMYGGDIKVNVNARLNNYLSIENGKRIQNLYNIGALNLQVLPILKYNGDKAGTIKPALKPVTTKLNVILTDAYNSKVEQGKTDGLWNFYGIKKIDFEPSAAKYPELAKYEKFKKKLDAGIKVGTAKQTSDDATPVAETGYGIQVVNGNELEFSTNGYSVTTQSIIFVPFVVVTEDWGELFGYAQVVLEVTQGN